MASLWWKAWRESRGRFLGAVPLIAAMCAMSVTTDLDTLPLFPRPTLEQHVWATVHHGAVRLLFTIVALTLGLGGLRPERLAGTEAYTLALPVTRTQLVTTRAVVGLLQVVALAGLPLVLVPALSASYHDHGYPFAQSWRFFLLFVTCGAAWFAVGFLCSVLFSGDYTAAAVALSIPVIGAGLGALPALDQWRWVNLLNVMSGSGMPYLNPRTRLLIELPWATVAAVTASAVALMVMAAMSARRDDA